MWKFIVDVVHDFVSSLQPDVGRGFLHVSNVFLFSDGPVDNKLAVIQVMACHWTGNKSLPEPMVWLQPEWRVQPDGLVAIWVKSQSSCKCLTLDSLREDWRVQYEIGCSSRLLPEPPTVHHSSGSPLPRVLYRIFLGTPVWKWPGQV